MRRAIVGAAMAAALVGIGVAVPAQAAPKQDKPVAIFEWEIPERTHSTTNRAFKPAVNVAHRMIKGPDGEPGLYGGVSSVPLAEIKSPDDFEVTLDACASTGEITQYEWRVDGKLLYKDKECKFTTRLTEKPHQVKLKVDEGGRRASTTHQKVTPRDILVVSMGDSYSSGEGNPTKYVSGDDTPEDSSLEYVEANNGSGWSEGGLWDYANCHRSTRSGQANAAIDLEKADPHSSVTFIYVACSGAQVDTGILGIKHGSLGGDEDPQAKQVSDLMAQWGNGRDIDAVMLGIGGNDIGFVPIVAECVFQQDCFLSTQGRPVLTPDLPVTDKKTPLDKDDLEAGRLLLKPDTSFDDMDPGPPFRTLERETLHACDATYQDALLGDGGIGPNEACRESIGTSPAGLEQVAQCLNGKGEEDCESVPTYYDFTEGGYQHEGGDTWPGLNVPKDKVFYTEYPDLTTKFTTPSEGLEGGLDYCNLSFTAEELETFIEWVKQFLDNPDVVEAQFEALGYTSVEAAAQSLIIGLTPNEFQYAAEAVLGGKGDPRDDKVLTAELTSLWNVRIEGATTKKTIGPATKADLDLDYVSLGKASPALNEVTALSAARNRYRWTPVTGTFERMSGHGLCVNPFPGTPGTPWAYLFGSAQGTNISGSAHPNLLGMETYREPLSASLKASLL